MRVDNQDEAEALMVDLLKWTEFMMPPGFCGMAKTDDSTGICIVTTSPVVTHMLLEAINGLMASLAEPPAEPQEVRAEKPN